MCNVCQKMRKHTTAAVLQLETRRVKTIHPLICDECWQNMSRGLRIEVERVYETRWDCYAWAADPRSGLAA